MEMQLNFTKTLISEDQIKLKLKELGEKITKDYQNKDLVVLCVLKGSIIFTADLVREIKLPLTIETIRAKSYVGTQTTQNVLLSDFSLDSLEGKDLLIVEDILESGYTLSKIKAALIEKNPASVKLCTLLYKKELVKTDIEPDYYGFKIGPEFVVGYGLDYNGEYRNIPYIAVPNDD